MAELNESPENLPIRCLQCLQLGFPPDLNRHPDPASKEQHVDRHLEVDFSRKSPLLGQLIWNRCFPKNPSINETSASKSTQENENGQVLLYKCGKCGRNFIERNAFKQHLDEIHLKIDQKLPKNSRSCKDLGSKSKNSNPLCKKRFSDKSSISRQMNFAHKRSSLKTCTICSKSFRDMRDLNRHLRGVHKKIIPPTEPLIPPKHLPPPVKPSRGLRRKKKKVRIGLQRNEKRRQVEGLVKEATIDGRVEWSCLECKKKYSSKGNLVLVTHISGIHLEVKPFQCPKCGRRFAQKINMVNHLKTHKVAKA